MGDVVPITSARRYAATMRRQKRADVCGCGCGRELEANKRAAYDPIKGVAYRIECWLRIEGLE
jgi:hypothetical protein